MPDQRLADGLGLAGIQNLQLKRLHVPLFPLVVALALDDPGCLRREQLDPAAVLGVTPVEGPEVDPPNPWDAGDFLEDAPHRQGDVLQFLDVDASDGGVRFARFH